MASPKPNHARREAIVTRYAYSLLTMREVGAEFGITGQRVQQVVRRSEIDCQAQRARTRELLKAKTKREVDAKLLAAAPPCVVCGEPTVRAVGHPRTRKTCSPACAEAWRVMRYQLSQDSRDRHRLAVARSNAKTAEPGSSRHRSAVEFLRIYDQTGVVPERNRVFSPEARLRMSQARKAVWAKKRAEAT